MKMGTGKTSGVWGLALALILFCGVGIGGCVFASNKLNPEFGRYLDVPSMNVARGNHTATLLDDGRVFLAGGFGKVDGKWQYLASTEFFHPSTRSFSNGPNLLQPRGRHIAVKLQDGRVMLIGGGNAEPEKGTESRSRLPRYKNVDSVEIFDPSTETVEAIHGNFEAKAGMTAIVLDDGTVLIQGGKPSVMIFNPSTNKIENGPRLEGHFIGQSAIKLGNGDLLFSGGVDSPGKTTIFNNRTRRFEQGPNLNFKRSGHKMVMLSDGNVLVLGGATKTGTVTVAELYNVSKKRLEIIETELPVSSARGLSLMNGMILVVGTHVKTKESHWAVYDSKHRQFRALKGFPKRLEKQNFVHLKSRAILFTGRANQPRNKSVYVLDYSKD